MRSGKKIICLLALLLFFVGCQKKPFKIITVKGRLMDKSSGAAMGTVVYLYTIDKFSAQGNESKAEKIELTEAPTSPDGAFTLRTHASKNDSYFLLIRDKQGFPKVIEGYPNCNGFKANHKKTTDLGEIKASY